MHFIKNSNLIEQATQHFLSAHPCHYSLAADLLPLLAQNPNLSLKTTPVTTCASTKIQNKHTKNDTKLHIIHNCSNPDNIIIYIHGLSSYCLQSKFLVKQLGDSFGLCMFDARAHGKNTSSYVTYGLLESEELEQIIEKVVEMGYKNIFLWGRSMGAVTALRFLQHSTNNQLLSKIKYVVADAPFSSFKSIATDIVSKATHLPHFLSLILADTFADKIKEQFKIDLREIDLADLTTSVPVHFLYSSQDELMGDKHMQTILKSFKGSCQVTNTEGKHNDQRPNWVISKVMAKLEEIIQPNKDNNTSCASKKKGLSITKGYMHVLQTSSPKASKKAEEKISNIPYIRNSFDCFSNIQPRNRPTNTGRVIKMKENLPSNFEQSCVRPSFESTYRADIVTGRVSRTITRTVPPNRYKKAPIPQVKPFFYS